MTYELDALIRAASTELGSDACRAGKHDWQTMGGRGCPHPEDIGEGICTQTVYVCRTCGNTDYGEKGGPGHDVWFREQCMDIRRNTNDERNAL